MAIGELGLTLDHVRLLVELDQRNGHEVALRQLLLTVVKIATDQQTMFENAK